LGPAAFFFFFSPSMLSVLCAAAVGGTASATGVGDSPSFASVAQLATSWAHQASEHAAAALTAMQHTGGEIMADIVQRHQQHQLQSHTYGMTPDAWSKQLHVRSQHNQSHEVGLPEFHPIGFVEIALVRLRLLLA
jgi:hypothetical protein